MLGFNQTFNFTYDDSNNNQILQSIDLSFEDIDFNEATITIEDYILDFEVKTENATRYGWITEDYLKIQTYCEADHGFGVTLNELCKIQRSFENNLKTRIIPNYPPFKKQYQDPSRICYTPNSRQAFRPKTDRITLDLAKIAELKHETGKTWEDSSSDLPFMKIYIHMQGQFMRGIHKEMASFTKRELSLHCRNYDKLGFPIDEMYPGSLSKLEECFGSRLTFDISQVTLLKSRHDSKNPCNPQLKDEDSKIREIMMNDKDLGCVPAYWKEFQNSTGYQECDNMFHYRYISNMTANFTEFDTGFEDSIIGKARLQFDPPCDEMIIVTNKQLWKGSKLLIKYFEGNSHYMIYENETSLRLDLEFNNVNPVYQVIENGRSFSVESCWAGIGGFIGIFVGVSMRQIPGLISDLFSFIKKSCFI